MHGGHCCSFHETPMQSLANYGPLGSIPSSSVEFQMAPNHKEWVNFHSTLCLPLYDPRLLRQPSMSQSCMILLKSPASAAVHGHAMRRLPKKLMGDSLLTLRFCST